MLADILLNSLFTFYHKPLRLSLLTVTFILAIIYADVQISIARKGNQNSSFRVKPGKGFFVSCFKKSE